MPNVLDVEPVRVTARRIAGKIASPEVAARFEKLAYERLLGDPRNFRAASAAEIAAGPRWAQGAAARGEDVSVFKLDRGASMRLHNLARRLVQVCALAAAQAPRPAQERYVVAAREFIDKIDRASFEVVARKAQLFCGLYAGWSDVNDILCEAGTVAATRGCVWIRITSLPELRGIGREMTNCLARTSETAAYGGHLKDGRAQFWVLRDPRGVALMVAMASTTTPTDFREVKGPRNTPVSRTNVDLQCLADAILAPPREPPHPPEPNPPLAPAIALFTHDAAHRARLAMSPLLLALGSEEPVAHVGVASAQRPPVRRRRQAS